MDPRTSLSFERMAQTIIGYDREEIVMGIDPSLNNTGVAVFRGNKARTFSIGWGPEVGVIHRLDLFRKEMLDLIRRYRPTVIALEGYSFGSKFSRPHSLGELGGVLKLAIMDSGVRLIIVPPTTLKQFVRGVGKGTKDQMLKDAKKRWQFQTSQNDEIDAGALAFVAAEVQYHVGQQYGHVLYMDKKGKGGVEIFDW